MKLTGTVIIYYLLSVCIKMVNNLIYKFIEINLLILFGIGWLEVGANGRGGNESTSQTNLWAIG